MALRRRITNALRATNTARKEAKQPPADPHQLFLRAHTERQRALEEARRALADLAMHERRAHLMAGQAAADAQRFNAEATAAVQRGEEQRARDLLERAIDAENAQRQWLARRDGNAEEVALLKRDLDRLERQAEQARARQLALLADQEAAVARARAAERIPQLDAGFAQNEDQVRRSEAEARARAELAWSDPTSAQVLRAFEELSADQEVRDRLTAIQRELGAGGGEARPQVHGPWDAGERPQPPAPRR